MPLGNEGVIAALVNVMSYTDEDRERILSDARAALERTADVRVERSNVVYISESRVDRQRREIEEQDREFERQRRERTVEQIERRLSEHLNGMMLEQKDFLLELITEVVGEMLATLRDETDQKLAELRSSIDSEILDVRALISGLRQQVSDLQQQVSNTQVRSVVTLPRRA